MDVEFIDGELSMKKWKIPKFKKMIGDLYKTKYGWVVTCPKNLNLGKNTDIGFGTYINARFGVIIEDNVQIGAGVKIYSHNTINNTQGIVLIEKDACIGANSVILPNVLIKEGKLIKANSTVYRRENVVIARSPIYHDYVETVLEGEDKN